jgi:hypothetical protein
VEKGVENVDFYFRSTPAMSGGTTCMILSAETPKAGVLVQANQKTFSSLPHRWVSQHNRRGCYGSSDPVSTRDVSRDRKPEKAHPEVGKGKSGMTNSGMFILRGAGPWLKLGSCCVQGVRHGGSAV